MLQTLFLSCFRKRSQDLHDCDARGCQKQQQLPQEDLLSPVPLPPQPPPPRTLDDNDSVDGPVTPMALRAAAEQARPSYKSSFDVLTAPGGHQSNLQLETLGTLVASLRMFEASAAHFSRFSRSQKSS